MVRLEGHFNLKTKGTQIIRKYIKKEKRDQLRKKENFRPLKDEFSFSNIHLALTLIKRITLLENLQRK